MPVAARQRPLCGAFRTHVGRRATSVLGHFRTHATQQKALLFDHLVGAHKESLRDREAERSCRFAIDDQFEASWCLHWQIARFLAPKNPVYVGGRLSE